MGRLTPDPPRSTRALFRCPYCRRYGAPGACEGCGAPTASVERPYALPELTRPIFPANRIVREGDIPARRPDLVKR